MALCIIADKSAQILEHLFPVIFTRTGRIHWACASYQPLKPGVKPLCNNNEMLAANAYGSRAKPFANSLVFDAASARQNGFHVARLNLPGKHKFSQSAGSG
jgi:hypothetical protein